MKKSDILFFLFVIALFLPFFISDTIYEWYKSFNAIHGMVMSFVKFAILATLGEMLGLRISTGVYHNKTFGIIPRMVIWGVLGVLLAIVAKKKYMYNEYQPSLLLAPYIDKYWEFKGNPDYGMKINILPDGCTDFIFTLGEVADIAEQESLIMQPYRSYFVGPMSRYSTLITYAKSIHMFGIRFLPCGLFRFMQLPLEELGNQRISTFESGGIFNDSLAERLCEQPYIQDKIRLIESFLTQALCTNNKIEKQISYAVDCINLSKGQLPIRSLVENVCLCQRHFERKFKHQTGYSPKEYSRIIKFKNAVDLLRSTSSNQLFSVAIEAGYYDTAHLSKEIKALSGNTPGSFLSLPVTEETTLTYLKL